MTARIRIEAITGDVEVLLSDQPNTPLVVIAGETREIYAVQGARDLLIRPVPGRSALRDGLPA